MDAKNSVALSLSLHGLLLVAAGAFAGDPYLRENGDGGGSGFVFRLEPSVSKFALIERPIDRFEGRRPAPETAFNDGVFNGASFGSEDGRGDERWGSICCVCGCGGTYTTVVGWPKQVIGYFDRRLSMATSRRPIPGLKAHARRCAYFETGEDSDCNCGLLPRNS